jgi:DNA-binding GntR family transcriptional regulator
MTKDISPIYDDIADAIITMKLVPGEKISEIESSKKYNVSRTPIRDVFKRLEDNGLLEIRSQSGTFVTKIDMGNIADLVYIRNCCEYAVLCKLAGKITKEQADHLYDNLAKQQELSENISHEKFAADYFRLDNEFHRYIYSLAGKEGILQILNADQPNFQRYRFITFLRQDEELKRLNLVHTNMVKALVENDYQALRDIVYEHNYSGFRGIDKVIETHPEYFMNIK